jgi:hypothetical protein
MQAVTEVSETAQGLMNSFEDAMAIMGDCADTVTHRKWGI